MGIVAILSGGIFGGLTALVSLIGFGAEWSEAVLTYLLSGSIFAGGMLFSMSAGAALCTTDNQMAGWTQRYPGN